MPVQRREYLYRLPIMDVMKKIQTKPLGVDSLTLLGMMPNERKEWPLWMANDIRPKICYLHRQGRGKWITRTDKTRRKLIVTRYERTGIAAD